MINVGAPKPRNILLYKTEQNSPSEILVSHAKYIKNTHW